MNTPVVPSLLRAAVLGLLASNTACSSSDSGDKDQGVTSSKVIADLSLEDFTLMCDEAAGTVEIHPSCGGVVSGKGFSYDSGTDVFTEHTCEGYNTCAGFSCVLE
jgi:hypothetical protein